MQTREIMKEWVKQSLVQLGGRATIIDICKNVWENHKIEIQDTADLFYQWQYEIRWAGDLLRREGTLVPARTSPRGVWELAASEQ